MDRGHTDVVLGELGAEVIPVGVSPDGFNINDGVGSTDMEGLAAIVRERGADLVGLVGELHDLPDGGLPAHGDIDELIEELDEDCLDAVGEIANMIAGNAKTDFPGGANAISVPRVIIGRDNVPYPPSTPIITIPCETDQGRLHIDVALKST